MQANPDSLTRHQPTITKRSCIMDSTCSLHRRPRRFCRRGFQGAWIAALILFSMVSAKGVGGQETQRPPGLSKPACDVLETEASVWTQQFLEAYGRLPQYPDIVELPTSMARAVVVALPPKDQYSFWQFHMQTFLSPEAPLSEAERTALMRASSLLAVDLFERAAREGGRCPSDPSDPPECLRG